MLTIAGSMELWPRSSARREIRTMWLMSLGGSVRPRPHRGQARSGAADHAPPAGRLTPAIRRPRRLRCASFAPCRNPKSS